jgi:excisionase family DNA binding protein
LVSGFQWFPDLLRHVRDGSRYGVPDVGHGAGGRGVTSRPSLRLALSPDEASSTLGVSRDYFDEHVRPELRVIRRGRRVLIAVRELERWLERSACRALESDERRF